MSSNLKLRIGGSSSSLNETMRNSPSKTQLKLKIKGAPPSTKRKLSSGESLAIKRKSPQLLSDGTDPQPTSPVVLNEAVQNQIIRRCKELENEVKDLKEEKRVLVHRLRKQKTKYQKIRHDVKEYGIVSREMANSEMWAEIQRTRGNLKRLGMKFAAGEDSDSDE